MTSRRTHRGLFVTFEGVDGCGKSTQLRRTARYLEAEGHRVVTLREPGSTRVAEKIRKLLLDPKTEIGDLTELLLYEAARAEIVRLEIRPQLERGVTVLCDRFYDSTTAYQGYGRGLDLKMVRQLHRVATGGITPELTFVFDVTPRVAALRLGKERDRLEGQPAAFHRRVRDGFKQIAKHEPGRVKLIDGSDTVAQVFERVRPYLDRRFRRP